MKMDSPWEGLRGLASMGRVVFTAQGFGQGQMGLERNL